ncbi:MAG: histidine phosphatase family protein [Pseudomonadota bacterium]
MALTSLLLLRHASAAFGGGVSDLERPLTEAGEHEALTVGHLLRERGSRVDTLLVSPARRTRQTATFSLPDGPAPQLVDDIYEASTGQLIQVLEAHGAGATLMVGHNPGFSELAGFLSGKPQALRTGQLVSLTWSQPPAQPLQPGEATISFLN